MRVYCFLMFLVSATGSFALKDCGYLTATEVRGILRTQTEEGRARAKSKYLRLAISPTGERALASRRTGVVELWEILPEKVSLSEAFPGEVGGFFPDGQRVWVYGAGVGFYVYELGNRELSSIPINQRPDAAMGSMDGTEVYLLADGQINFVNLAEPAVVRPLGGVGEVRTFELLSNQRICIGAQCAIGIWSPTVVSLQSFSGIESAINALRLHEAGGFGLYLTESRTIGFFELRNQSSIGILSTGGAVGDFQISPDGKFVAVARLNQPVELWNLSRESNQFSAHLVRSFPLYDKADVVRLMFSGNNLVIQYDDHSVEAWSLEETPRLTTSVPPGIFPVACHPTDGLPKLFAGGDSGVIELK